MHSAFRRHFQHHFSKVPEAQLEENVYRLNEPFATLKYGCSLVSQQNQGSSSQISCVLCTGF